LGPGAQGLAGAFTAVADDPTAIIYNPAGLTQISPAKRSLSYNAYSKMSYRAGKILFGSDVEFNADNFPFFVGTTYRHPEILSDWTFAFGAFDNGSYSIRTKWEVAGK